MTIENVSGETKVWTSNSCQVPAEITIDLSGILDRGDDWEGRPGDFKTAALDGTLGDEAQRLGRYRVDLVSATGGTVGLGCDDIRLSNDLAAGERLEVTWAWDGSFAPGQGSPALPAVVEATFPLESVADISVDLDVKLDEVDDRTLTPGQVIDIALADESIRSFVEAKWSGPPKLRFDRVYTDELAWELTIFDFLTGRSARVAVDPYSGEITFVEIR